MEMRTDEFRSSDMDSQSALALAHQCRSTEDQEAIFKIEQVDYNNDYVNSLKIKISYSV